MEKKSHFNQLQFNYCLKFQNKRPTLQANGDGFHTVVIDSNLHMFLTHLLMFEIALVKHYRVQKE